VLGLIGPRVATDAAEDLGLPQAIGLSAVLGPELQAAVKTAAIRLGAVGPGRSRRGLHLPSAVQSTSLPNLLERSILLHAIELQLHEGRGMRVSDFGGGGSTLSTWRRPRGDPSLSEVHRSIPVARQGPVWRKLAAFLGPGYLVAVGYMDPGNWATSLAGGAKFGFALLFIALLSNIMAIILQHLCARMAIATGRDLAQACRDAYPRYLSYPLWFLAEIAICATDLAEVIGTAIGLGLLFGIPLEIGVIITAADVFVILWLQNKGFRWIEAFIITLLGVIALCFVVQITMADPVWGNVLRGFIPTTQIVTNPDMLYLALGIIGATVMPHNLYLHSGIVQTRAYGESLPEKREAVKFATIDSTVALMFALTINASILILAGAAFHTTGNTGIEELEKAHTLLSPLLGSSIAPTLFAIALLCCGLNSTVTATMAGQIVMEGFLDLKLPPWLRRLVTRIVAIVPAALVTIAYGESGTAKLLILSQVILSLQLPFAIIPLVLITANRGKMGELRSPVWLTAISGVIGAVIVVLNVKLIVDFVLGS
jgi:manganese transport protein